MLDPKELADVLLSASTLLKKGDGLYEVKLAVSLAVNGDKYLYQYAMDEIHGAVGGWPQFLFDAINGNYRS